MFPLRRQWNLRRMSRRRRNSGRCNPEQHLPLLRRQGQMHPLYRHRTLRNLRRHGLTDDTIVEQAASLKSRSLRVRSGGVTAIGFLQLCPVFEKCRVDFERRRDVVIHLLSSRGGSVILCGKGVSHRRASAFISSVSASGSSTTTSVSTSTPHGTLQPLRFPNWPLS
jgi:hypothetical protein